MNTLTMLGVLREKGEPKFFNDTKPLMNGIIECPRQTYDGEVQDPELFEFSAFNDVVGKINRIPIGTMIYVDGSLRSKPYEKDGQKRLFTSITVKNVRVV